MKRLDASIAGTLATRGWRRCAAVASMGLAGLLFTTAASASNTEIAGVRYEATARVGGQSLVLNGSGLSYKALQKVYTVGLYTPSKNSNADGVLAMTGPKQLRFVILVPMRVDELGKLISRGIEHNSTRDEFMRLIPSTIDMGRIFAKMRRMAPGDTIAIEWVPNRGTVFYVNGVPTGMPVAEPLFFNAVLKVWIGKNPTTQDLKDALLDYKAPPLLNALE
jgi:Chalcone isomerase-like